MSIKVSLPPLPSSKLPLHLTHQFGISSTPLHLNTSTWYIFNTHTCLLLLNYLNSTHQSCILPATLTFTSLLFKSDPFYDSRWLQCLVRGRSRQKYTQHVSHYRLLMTTSRRILSQERERTTTPIPSVVTRHAHQPHVKSYTSTTNRSHSPPICRQGFFKAHARRGDALTLACITSTHGDGTSGMA